MFWEFRGLLQCEAFCDQLLQGLLRKLSRAQKTESILNEEGQQLHLFLAVWSLGKRELSSRNSLFLSKKTSVIEFLICTWLFQNHIIDKRAFIDRSNENLQMIGV